MSKLIGARLKLRRAKKHLDCAKTTVETFIKDEPYTFSIETNPKPPRYAIVARVKQLAPDDELSLVIGDFANNARSALNLLVAQLSELPSDDNRRLGLQFPIFDEADSYRDHVESYLAGVHFKHIARIQGCQPYQRANGFYDDALSLLAYINDADKHRLIHTVGAVVAFRGMGIRGPGRLGNSVIVGTGTAIRLGHSAMVSFGEGFTYTGIGDGVITKDRTIVAELTIKPPTQVNMRPEAEVTVKFGEGSPRVEGRLIMSTLDFIYDRVEEVIGELEKPIV